MGIFWLILVKDAEPYWQVLTDVYNGQDNFYTFSSYHFIEDLYGSDREPTNVSALIKVWYYAITTLSTIGFGDFRPISVYEKVFGAFILMFGVAIFSYIMGTFMEILSNYRSLEAYGDHKNLTKWIALLSKYNDGEALNREIITKVESFFDFYWENNRLHAFETELDKKFISELPEYTI